MTDLWMVRIDRPMRQAESEALLALLPQERRNRLHGHTLEKQPEVLCAYGLLLALLRKRCGWQGFPAVARNAEDKPFFPAYPGVCFSISHTEGAAAAAVAETSIGVDIQRIQTPPRRLARLTGTDDPDAFFRSWVRLEACAKRTGTGILHQLHEKAAPAPETVYSEIETFPGYAAGAAGQNPLLPGEIRWLTLDELLRCLDICA